MGVMRIPLTRGYEALVDEADYPRVSAIKWRAKVNPSGITYATAHKPGSGRRGASIQMHRFILGAEDCHTKVDHWDGNGLNNSRANLRACTNAQNTRNAQKRRVPTSSKFKGVHWNSESGLWRAAIQLDYKKINLGEYSTEDIAARVYDAQALVFFGEFARLNFPAELGRYRERPA